MQGIRLASEKIIKAKQIAILSHINPDGDSIGSVLSLGLGLKRLGKRVHMISQDGVPQRYRDLPGANRIVRGLKRPVDLAIAVDCSNKEILGKSFSIFKGAKDVLEIDHHEFRRPLSNNGFIDIEAAAVGELIYLLLVSLKVELTSEIAENLLTSIIVETNSFRLPNVRPFTFKVCTELVERGVNFYKLVNMVFWSRTRQSAILSGMCMSRCRFKKKGRLAWSIMRQKDFTLVKGRDEDIDAVADEIRSIKEVMIVVLFREKDKGELRVSLRSKGEINVGAIAEYYHGGGHFDSAGCEIPNNARSIRKVLAMAEKLL